MQGTGAYDDPFIVTDFYELFEACAQTVKYVNLGADLDGSEYNSGVWDKPIIIDCNYIDGKGHTIKNILDENGVGILKQNNSTYNFKITNINFENIISKIPQYNQDKGCFILSDSTINPCITFENCYFSLDVSNLCRCTKSNQLYNGVYTNFIRCSLDYTENLSQRSYVKFHMCNIHVKLNDDGYNVKGTIADELLYSRIEIEVPANVSINSISGDGCVVSITSDSDNSEVNYQYYSSYGSEGSLLCICNISGIKYKATPYEGGEPFYINDDVCYGGIAFLSEEHMKSAEYLNKIGFAAAPE